MKTAAQHNASAGATVGEFSSTMTPDPDLVPESYWERIAAWFAKLKPIEEAEGPEPPSQI